MESTGVSDQIKRLQCVFFGQRYSGATISNVRLLHEHSEKLYGWLQRKSGILVLAGIPGCGKTHLCAAIVGWMFGKVSDIYGIKESDFLKRIRDSMDMQGDYQSAIKYQCDHEFFLYDDLGSTGQGQTGWRQEVLFEMINTRYETDWPTIITTNFTRKEISDKIGPRAYSRMYSEASCIIEMFNYPDLRKPLSFREPFPEAQKTVLI